jgi:RND family efflux transporter MFP subunit
VASAQASRIARVLNTTGTVAARDLVPVLPQANGLQVKQILVGEGQEVRAEQVMAVLDDSVLRAQIEGARAEIESKQATVQQRQAALQQARATEADAQRTLERFQILANNGAISRQELDTRSTTAATTAEATRVAQANIGTAQADVRSSVAKLQQLQTQLGQTVVRAPVSGIVAEKIVNLGDVTNGTQKLFTLIGNGALELQAQVPATQLPQVRTGASAKITSDTDSRVSLSGTVREIAPLVNAQSRQALVRIDVPATTLLRPGMFARAAITTTTNTGVTVPNKAIQPQSDGSIMVFLLSGEDKVQARKVEVGEVVNGGNVEIKNGLKQGDRVVVAGAGYLKDGDRVRIASQ